MINTTGISSDISQATAAMAFNGTSFSPERRGAQVVAGYVETMQSLAAYIEKQAKEDRQQEIAQELFERLRAKYRQRTQAWIGAHSRCISSMIAGPSKFPVRRAEKANNSEHNRMGELIALEKAMFRYVDNALASVYSKAEKTQTELEAMQEKLAKAEAAQEFMKQANALFRKKKPEELEALYVKQYGAGGSKLMAATFLQSNCFGSYGFERYELTNNLANIKRMRERVEILERKAKASEEVAKEHELNGLTIVRNTAEDRLQLLFEGKPGEKERAVLKSNGFKWSPRFMAWQRQLTPNAEYALKHYVLPNPLFAQYSAAA